jgi:hypothetical protein
MNNSTAPDPRSFAETYPHADPNKTLSCDISHDDATNVNTINSCHSVPR